MRKGIFGAILCCCLEGFLPAQTPAYLHYGVRDGLPSNLVYCGLQDKDGLLWFGTDKGLARFDGTRFRIYDMGDGLPDSEVFNLRNDSRGRLWMFCFRRKPCYRLNGRIVTASMDTLLNHIEFETAIGELAEDRFGQIWISSFSDRFYRLTDTSVTWIKGTGAINKVCCFPEGNIAGAGSTQQYFFIHPDGSYEHRKNEPEFAAAERYISFECRGDQLLWSTSDGLFLMQVRDGWQRIVDRSKVAVGRVFVDRSNRFWVCSLAGGAVCFDNTRKDLSNPVVYLEGKKITTLFEDRQGTLWFCTAGEGIYALPKNSPVTYGRAEGLISRNITAVALDPGGGVLAGDDEGKLYSLDQTNTIRHTDFGSLDGYNRVRQIVPLADGSRWVVTDEQLYYEFPDPRHPGVLLRHFYSQPLGHPKEIMARPGFVLLASSGRLYGIIGDFKDTLNLRFQRKTTVAEDEEGNAWVGGINEFYSEKDGFQANWSERFGLLNSRIVTIRSAGPGYIWVVTPESGLLRAAVANGAITSVEAVNPLMKTPIGNIQSLFAEPGGRLWMATNRGIFGLDSAWHVVHFDAHDGLADDDVNAVAAHHDTLWAATANGLSRMVLRSPDLHGEFPTFITALRYRHSDQNVFVDLLDSLPKGGVITLPPEASLVQLELAGLDFRGRGNLHFACLQSTVLPPIQWWTLDNLLARAWQGFRGRTDTTFVEESLLSFGVHLPPGAYRLRLSAINATGVVSHQPAEITLIMRPAWYQTFWITLFVWGLIVYVLWRMYRARAAYRDLNASVSALQLQALQAQINPHFVGNSINAIQQFFYPPDPVRASEYISTFTGLLRRTLLFSEKHFIPFLEELAYDRDYLQLIELRFGERFQFEIIGTDRVPSDTPFPCMLLQTLLENATIHGLALEGVSHLVLEFNWQGSRLVCTVTDNGVGIETSLARKKASGTDRKSKGLEMLAQKVETLNRLYDIDLQFNIRDLSEPQSHSGAHGTRAVISFYPWKFPVPLDPTHTSESVPPHPSTP